jgi:adenosylhomocysteine nucleosidase
MLVESAGLPAPLHVVVVTGGDRLRMPRDSATIPSEIAAGVIFALPVEADAFERLAEGRRETRGARFTFHVGVVAGRRVAWCVCGVGGEAAAAATRHLIAGHRPRVVVTAGFAGALDPSIPRGTVFRPSRAVTDGDAAAIDLSLQAGGSAPLTIVSVAAVVATVEAKRALAARTGAAAIDMETYAVAGAATQAGVPCLGVRVVSDDADQALPPEVAGLAARRSPLGRLGAAVGAIGRRPSAALDFWRLWEHAVVDSRTLAAAVVDLIAGLD